MMIVCALLFISIFASTYASHHGSHLRMARGSVCGSDGRKYINHCAFARETCKPDDTSYDDIFIVSMKYCDNQNLAEKGEKIMETWLCRRMGNCVNLPPTEKPPRGKKTLLCGVNGITYQACEFLKQKCAKKRAVIVPLHLGVCGNCSKDNVCVLGNAVIAKFEGRSEICSGEKEFKDTCAFSIARCLQYKKDKSVLKREICATKGVNGGYGDWSNFTNCTKSCGVGMQHRTRACDKPVPMYGGKNCAELGNATETRACNLHPCPAQRFGKPIRIRKGSICGSDRRKYDSFCTFMQATCKPDDRSHDKMFPVKMKYCEDESLKVPEGKKASLCGINGVTYQACQLGLQICKRKNTLISPLHLGECGICTIENVCSWEKMEAIIAVQDGSRKICAGGVTYTTKCAFSIASCVHYKRSQSVLKVEKC